VGTYIRNVVRTLARLDRDSKYVLIGSLAKVAECGALPPNFHAVELTGRDDTLKGNLAFRAIVRRLECDVVHVPHLFWIPRGLSCPYILTVPRPVGAHVRIAQRFQFATQPALLSDAARVAQSGARDRGVAIHQERN